MASDRERVSARNRWTQAGPLATAALACCAWASFGESQASAARFVQAPSDEAAATDLAQLLLRWEESAEPELSAQLRDELQRALRDDLDQGLSLLGQRLARGAGRAAETDRGTQLVLDLLRAERGPTLEALLEARALSPAAEERATALVLWGSEGSARRLPQLLALVHVERGERPAFLRAQFRLQLDALLQRDPGGLAQLRAAWPFDDAYPSAEIARALGDCERREAAALLADVLMSPDAPAQAALCALRTCSSRVVDRDERVDFAWRVKRHLDPSSPELCSAAALALGELGCAEDAPELLPLLESEARGVREAAHHALASIAGSDRGSELARWEAWLAQEQDWYRGEWPEQRAALSSKLRVRVVEALRLLATHRAHADELAAEIRPLVLHPDPALRELAVLTLARLASPVGVPALQEAREDPVESIAALAIAALD